MPRLDGLGLAAELQRLTMPPPMQFGSGYAHGGGELPGPSINKPSHPDLFPTAVARAMQEQPRLRLA